MTLLHDACRKARVVRTSDEIRLSMWSAMIGRRTYITTRTCTTTITFTEATIPFHALFHFADSLV